MHLLFCETKKYTVSTAAFIFGLHFLLMRNKEQEMKRKGQTTVDRNIMTTLNFGMKE